MDIHFNLPVYVEALRGTAKTDACYRVCPLFFPQFRVQSPFFQEALAELRMVLRNHLGNTRFANDQGRLASWTWNPEMETEFLEIHIEAGSRSRKVSVLVIRILVDGRTYGFSPSFPDLWFDLQPSDEIKERLEQVANEYLRKKQEEDEELDLEQYHVNGTAWRTMLTLRMTPELKCDNQAELARAFLGRRTKMNGAWELQQTGDCLNELYPDRLDRALFREQEIEDLVRHLSSPERRPILIIGPRQVGKTTIIHDAIYRLTQARSGMHTEVQNVWLLAPQRLISGMSYVGEWESRLQAIIEHAGDYDLTLYFDDLLGLLSAGVSSCSSLNVATLLKPVIEQRRVRILAEITPESLRVFRERAANLVDLFHVIRVEEFNEIDNLQVLLNTKRRLEETHQCRFDLDVIPTVIDLQRRFARESSFPGKATSFLTRLTRRTTAEHERQEDDFEEPPTENIMGYLLPKRVAISRTNVLKCFQEQTGLPLSFIDQTQTMNTAEVREGLSTRFVGQPAAVEAGSQIISLAKARLNDPSRPLASLLLLGPTGVGKTEFARSMATYLFGGSDRLVRFDMNEFVSAASVPQLIGTFTAPDGLLTAAIRRQPFAVLLFDEIEKAHPDVYDLLLQILGEGRLTDAIGRTTDFTNTIIVLTSNLGTRRADSGVGFSPSETTTDSVALAALRSFFRPEFLNRLDRVLPFSSLSREDLKSIARHLMADFLQRDGLARRRCILELHPAAMEWILQQGYHPALGARALKRAIERELTQPVARYLARTTMDALSKPNEEMASSASSTPATTGIDKAGDLVVIEVDRMRSGERRASELSVAVRSLRPITVAPATIGSLPTTPPLVRLAQAERIHRRLYESLPQLRVEEPIETGRMSPAQTRYFHVQEELARLSTWITSVQEDLLQHGKSERTSVLPPRIKSASRKGTGEMRVGYRYIKYGNIKLDPSVYDSSLKERTNSPSARRHTADDLGLVLAELAWLQTLCDASLSQLTERVTITIRSIDGMRPILAERLAHQLRELWNDVGLEAKLERKTIDSNGPRGLTWQIELSGSLANLWANVEEGYHVVEDSQTVIPTLISLKIDSQPLSERIVRTCAPKFFDEGISDGIREQAKRSFYASLPAPLECLS